jgi:hypothetical protein
MSKATEERILDFAHNLMQTVEHDINKEWGNPPAGAAYIAAKKQFQDKIEQRLRASEWMKEVS